MSVTNESDDTYNPSAEVGQVLINRTYSLPLPLVQEVGVFARRSGSSRNGVVRRALRQYLDRAWEDVEKAS